MLVTTVYVNGIPEQPDMYSLLIGTFKKFGRILNLKISGDKAIVQFKEDINADKIYKSLPMYIAQKKVKLKLLNEEESLKAEYPMCSELSDLLLNQTELIDHIKSLKTKSEEMEDCMSNRLNEEKLYKFIRQALSDIYPDVCIFPFGSRLSGLAFEDSDVDIFIDIKSLYRGKTMQDMDSQKKIVYSVSDVFERRSECQNITNVPKARVPIVSFYHKETELQCDLSFKNGLSCQNTRLIKYYVSLDWRVKELVLFLKEWCSWNNLHGPPLFSSYSITMLAFFYLQNLEEPIIPTVASLQEKYDKNRPRIVIADWDCSFCQTSGKFKTTNEDSLLTILTGFFQYYSEFDYKKYVLPLWLGKPLSRNDLHEWNIALTKTPVFFRHPIELERDFEQMRSVICVLDPFEKTHNITKGFCKTYLTVFKHYCALTFKKLKES